MGVDDIVVCCVNTYLALSSSSLCSSSSSSTVYPSSSSTPLSSHHMMREDTFIASEPVSTCTALLDLVGFKNFIRSHARVKTFYQDRCKGFRHFNRSEKRFLDISTGQKRGF
jgi:hypothetical protein